MILRFGIILLILFWCQNDVIGFLPNSATKLVRNVVCESNQKRISTINKRFSTDTNDLESEGTFLSTDSGDSELDILRHQKKMLESKLLQLEEENQNLQETCNCYQVVIERFEGEGRKSQTSEGLLWYENEPLNVGNGISINGCDEQATETAISSSLDDMKTDTCPLEPSISFLDAMRDRAYWLVGLLAFQSCSGFILSRNEALLETHPVIVYFLTMLVGAGGNAGNQASVRVIRGLALGSLNESTQGQFLWRELKMAFALSTILSMAGFARAIIFSTPIPETVAVTCALALIVFSSICLGAILPLILKKLGIDPAHSSTTIQVVMDILGVVLTVFVSTLLLDNPIVQTYIDKITINAI